MPDQETPAGESAMRAVSELEPKWLNRPNLFPKLSTHRRNSGEQQ